MARRPPVGDNELFLISTYLTNSEARTEIHAEIPFRYRDEFEAEYAGATNNFPLPRHDSQHSYYV